MLTCKIGNTIINCFDGKYDKFTLKKWSEENRLVCPDCGSFYEYCHGEVIHPYFRHKEKNKDCEGIYYEPETEEHIRGKLILYNWLQKLQKDNNEIQDIKLESYIPETRQRPDLSFRINNKRYVIEFQCSPIATEYLERHRLYQLAGIYDIWILGTDKYIEKSEVQKKFKEKEIERNTFYYLDSKYNIFIFNNVDIFNFENNNIFKHTYDYFYQDKRSLVSSELLLLDKNSNKFMISMEEIKFNNGKILLSDKAIDNIKKYSELIIKERLRLQEINQKCESFLEKLFLNFENKYMTTLDEMRCKYGFKCSKHYYQFKNIDDFPIIDFCKLNYINNIPESNLIFKFNIENETSDKIIEYLKIDLQETIDFNIKMNSLRIEYEGNKKNELNNLKQELSQFKSKPLYLLFLEDNNKIDKNIRFKMIHNYPNDIIKLAKIILDDLKFIKSKGAKEYILMIPRKRIKKSSSSYYPYYKVRNYKPDVKDDFTELGFSFLEYKDLLEVKNIVK